MAAAPRSAGTKKPTIAVVAAQAGVAVSTVSRFLNGHYVSPEVRARLAQVIETLGYSRSWTARNLSLGRRGSIGVVVDSIEDPWFVQVLLGIEEELASRDSSLMLASLELLGRYDPALVFGWIREHRIDGMILAKTQRRDRPIVHASLQAKLPVVVVAPDERLPDVQVLNCNNVEAGGMIADHLADLGHTRIAFAGGPAHSLDSRHRLRGLREGLARRRLRLDPSLIYSCGGWAIETGTTFARSLLGRPLPMTAIVFANDALALGFLRVAHERGVRVPQDVSVAGFDGLTLGALSWPSLTTVAQPIRDMGRVACRRLFEAIAAPGKVEQIQFRMTLLPRESSARIVPVTEKGHLKPVVRSDLAAGGE